MTTVLGRERSALATRRAASAGFPTGKTFDAWQPEASSIPAPTQQALRTLEWVHRRENLVVCGPSGTGKTFLRGALGQQAVEKGLKVAWFTLEDLGVLLRRHRADNTATVDRLRYHAHVCQTSGDSVRLTQALAGQGASPLN